jgi:hypothetical protein
MRSRLSRLALLVALLFGVAALFAVALLGGAAALILPTHICVNGWTKTIRPPASYTTALKKKQLVAWGYVDQNPKHYEEDHLISLELGGAPWSKKNLWPEPHSQSIEADPRENAWHKQVCNGTLTVKSSHAKPSWRTSARTDEPLCRGSREAVSMSSDASDTQAPTPLAEATAAADSARNRGQSAWAISSALAGALIAGGALTNASDRPWWVQLCGLLAIAAWILTATLFISAVSGIDPIRAWRGGRKVVLRREPSPQMTVEQARADRLAIDQQLNLAYFATVVAIGCTLAALIAGLVSSVKPQHLTALVVLRDKEMQQVRSICAAATGETLKGDVERDTLTHPFVVIVLEKGQCQPGEVKRKTLEVPPSAIESFRTRQKHFKP